MAKGDIKIRVEDYLALRRDSEALARVREVYNAFMTHGGMTYTTFIGQLKSAIADAGEES